MIYEHWNTAEVLPPVGCPLVIRVRTLTYESAAIKMMQFSAERTAHIDDRSRDMTYKLLDGSLLTGRYEWTYP